jgi:transposase InsO family protein
MVGAMLMAYTCRVTWCTSDSLHPITQVLSDRGSNILTAVIREVCKIFRIQKVDIAAYHPESNANIERVHRLQRYVG